MDIKNSKAIPHWGAQWKWERDLRNSQKNNRDSRSLGGEKAPQMAHTLDECPLFIGPHLSRQSGVKSIGSDGRKGLCWAMVLSMPPSAPANLKNPA